MEKFQSILRFLVDRKVAIGYSFMALLTMGGERLFSLVAFQCPCNRNNFPYGMVFLLAPAWVLLVISYFLNNRAWRLFTGCCKSSSKATSVGSPAFCRTCLRGFRIFSRVTLEALVAPLMWLSVALLHGTFYECAMSGTSEKGLLWAVCEGKTPQCHEELHKVVCGQTALTSQDTQELKRALQAQSQILGWILISVISLVSLLVACCSRCWSKVSHLQMKFWKIYAQKEREQIEKAFQERAGQLSARNLQCFLENKQSEPFALPSIKAWEDASDLHLLHPGQQHYSTLHRVVEGGMKRSPTGSEMALDFMDGHHAV
ncbi:calcium homeostasis modulator protein 5 [Ornithorhynchus anatinus]|uniref:Calcium homeostasis modulator family member 5 n=1 Tax=Ornithorhynchus anatinus TaxID=9258 RepID=F6URF3_ORNAN|nr:calcium homeostasis modulator protein 5 [Ornithorhynchus anatinus]